MEEINKLVCIQTTEDGWIIDPETGYVYDPLTGMPYDPVTGQPIDLGLIGGGSGGNQLELDCYNKFLNFIDYYEDRDDKPEEYDELVAYLACLLCPDRCPECLSLPGVEIWEGGDKDPEQGGQLTEGGFFIIRFCDLVIPDIPEEEEEEEELPDFPEIDLGTGVDDTWEDEEPAMTEIVADPMDVHEPVWWYHSDHLGSTTYITDLTGKPCQYIEYLPFGEVMVQQSTNNIFENSYKFNGKELDESTGYYYYGARYYDPGISIFLSVDPLAEQAPNWTPYRYGFNNPINFIDPNGMFESKSEAKQWAKENNIKTGWFSGNKISKSGEGSWSVDNKNDGVSYSRADSGMGLSTERADGVVESVFVNREKHHPYFSAVPSGEYGPYTPDGFGFSAVGNIGGFSASLSLVSDKRNNFGLYYSLDGTFRVHNIFGKPFGLAGTMDFYNDNGKTGSIFNNLEGESRTISAGFGPYGSYSYPVLENGSRDYKGVTKTSFGWSTPTVGYGGGKTYKIF